MCGIAGRLGPGSPGENRRMLERLVHRGPDDEGEHEFAGGWLGHRRLSIVDVDGGHQPLEGSAKRWLVGNGEVYNHAELRDELGGGPYRTRSDNEVALRSLEQAGPDALGRLEGMYAFLSAEQNGTGFVAARDPVGIKPLYWTPPEAPGDEVRFASEMSAFDPEVRSQVTAFPPGAYWTPERGLRRFARAVPRVTAEERPYGEPSDDDLAETRTTLIASVERQLMGDVPVGVFLSGGLDSTLIAAIAARALAARGMRLQTFAVGVERSPDILAARQAAEYLGTEHHERLYTQGEALEAVAPVVRSIEHFDPSLVRSAVPNYLLAEMTARHVKVVLTGEGADELFAGYEYLREFDHDPDTLHDELIRTVEGLHNLNLQRCDRVTMAHGLEARVPFLDRAVIALALRLPAAWKIAGPGVPEKRLLRLAFSGWLPDELLWREKAQFGDGSGAAAVIRDVVEAQVSDAEFADERDATDLRLRTREELAYYRIWRGHLTGIRPEANISRFATA